MFFVYVHIYIYTYLYYTHTYLHTYTHTYIHTYIHEEESYFNKVNAPWVATIWRFLARESLQQVIWLLHSTSCLQDLWSLP